MESAQRPLGEGAFIRALGRRECVKHGVVRVQSGWKIKTTTLRRPSGCVIPHVPDVAFPHVSRATQEAVHAGQVNRNRVQR